MGLFKSKRDIPDEEIYRPGDRYFDPELIKSSDLMRRWSDLYNAHEASTHVVEEGYTAEIADPSILEFVQGKEDGGATFNPGLKPLKVGTTEVTMTNAQGGIQPLTFTVKVTG